MKASLKWLYLKRATVQPCSSLSVSSLVLAANFELPSLVHYSYVTGRDNAKLDGNNAKRFLDMVAKLKQARLQWSELGVSGLARLQGDEPLVPAEAQPVLDTAELLHAVIDGTMGDSLKPNYKELIAEYGASLTAVLDYARNTLDQKTRTVTTWKEHVLVCHFPAWLDKRNNGTLEPGTARGAGKLRGSAAYSEQTGESCHSFFDDLVWRNFKLNQDNPRSLEILLMSII